MDLDFESKPVANRKIFKAVSLHVSINNEGTIDKPSLYIRLCKYAKAKGFTNGDVIRFMLSSGLEKAGY